MRWSLDGNYAENCNCDIMCPCLYLQPPTEGFCEAMLVWDIKTGHLNDVKLDGLKVSIWLHAPGPQLTEGGFKIALYIDENASDEQATALEELYGGKHGGHLGVIASLGKGEEGGPREYLPTRSASIQMTQNGPDRHLVIPVSYTHLRAHETPEHRVCPDRR